NHCIKMFLHNNLRGVKKHERNFIYECHYRRYDMAMDHDDKVILIGTDVAGGAGVDHLVQDDGVHEDAFGGVFGLSKGLVGKYGRERVIDTPIAEHGYFSAAVG